ncbi:M23 family metallopeptidase [Henriciella aquimarina]|uniref:M23 family metallopeptidase n=1 Tax=Henriciella aquimarina TaxID=545261 RepID=UPI001F3165C3|nr:M23 family metallopeptidase [Henriciella aquimarina]
MNFQFSRGMTSLVLLGAVATATCLSTLYFVAQSRRAEAQTPPAVQLATPLATTVLSAEEFTQSAETQSRSAELKPRETLIELVTDLGAEPSAAARSLQALYDAELIDPRRVRPGLTVTAQFRGAPQTAELTSLSVSAESGRQILSKRQSDGAYTPLVLTAHTKPVPKHIETTIETSIYAAALDQGAHDQQVVDFARVFAYDVDFQRDIHPGDRFEIVYEEMVDERGNPVETGNVLYAAINGQALDKGYYRFTPGDDGATDYFNRDGEAATKFLMKTPINGARLSSNFGYRRHPISGYNKLHKGTDFAAPTGTPVYAAGHGTIERSSRYGGYGNYVRIRHANGYDTAYAHLSKFGPGIRSGKRVRQGDIIGYVGSTGASTGPHLHYEVLVNDKQVNAMTLDLPTGRKLAETPEVMKAFEARRNAIDAMRNAGGMTLVSGGDTPSDTDGSAPPAP